MGVLNFLNAKAMKEIAQQIEKQYGFADLRSLGYVFYQNNKEKVYAVNEAVTHFPLDEVRVDNMGMYFMKINERREIRFSIEGSQIIGPLATKNIIDFNDEQIALWMRGEDVPVAQESSDFLLVRYKKDFVGCTKVKAGFCLNLIPKVRYILTS